MIKILFTITIYISSLFGLDSIEIINSNVIVKNSGYFKTSKDLTAQEAYNFVLSNELINLPKDPKGLGFDTDTYWFFLKISVTKNHSNIFLDLKDPLAESSTCYIFQNNNLISTEENGYMIKLEDRPINEFRIRFNLSNTNLETVYLIKIRSQYPIYPSFILGNENELNNYWHTDLIISILSIGIFLAMFIYNIFLYLVIRDKAYIFYCLYIFGFFTITVISKGYLTLVLPKLLIYTPLFVTLFLQIQFFGLVIFTIHFLNLRKAFPKFEKKIKYLLYINIGTCFLILFYPKLQALCILFMDLLYLALIYIGIKSYFIGFKPALHYLIATGMALIFTFTYSFMTQGLFLSYNLWSFNLMSFGLVWDVIFLAIALAYKIKLLQEDNIKNQKLSVIKSKQSSLGELSGNLAHQWRQPLAELGSISTSIEAQLKYGEISKEEILSQIKLNKNILNHLSQTINTFQSFFQNSNIETKFNVNDEIKRCIDFINDSMKNNLIDVIFLSDDNYFLQGNANEFSQIILNIVLNAKDALCEKDIENKYIKIELKKFDDKFKIEISDNAGGIKIEPIESIFESYITSKDKGIGIGLFIVKTIVEQKFNGKILASNTQVGTRFIMSF